jgi:hypothetical protein
MSSRPELTQMATTRAWKFHESGVTLSQKLDAGVSEQRSLEEEQCKTQVSRKELQKQHLDRLACEAANS